MREWKARGWKRLGRLSWDALRGFVTSHCFNQLSLVLCGVNYILVTEQCKGRSKQNCCPKRVHTHTHTKNQDSSLCSVSSHFCQNPSWSWNEMYDSCESTQHKCQCPTPAGADEHPLAGGGVRDGSVVVDESRVEGHTVHIQGHWGELDAEWQMMPLAVTHLLDGQHNSTWAWTKQTVEISIFP